MVDTGVPCTYCREDVDYSAGDPGDGEALLPVTCSHGGFVHARCMWHRAERLANGRVDPQPCVTCRSEWPVRSRPPHPAELAQGLPRSQSWEHPLVRRTPSAGCPPARPSQRRDDCFPRHVRAESESPREGSNFLVLLMLPVQRRSGPAFAGISRFPPLKGMGSSGEPLP